MRGSGFVLVLTVAAGCRVVVPGDGRVVLVEPDEAVDAAYSIELKRSVHFWDVTGACFRVREELVDGEPIAARVPFVADGARSNAADPQLAWYAEAEGRVHVPIGELQELDVDHDELTALFAHELGHALGLNHLPQQVALMAPHVPALQQLTDADVREFCTRWTTPICAGP
ncbi:MAG TPA: matrixin family metalloprotease [Polyangia bacterium]|nr:matrixin family metalloprotease [Polyangia bacterium]